MSYRNMLIDRCDIYKIKKRDKSLGYGIESKEKEFYYDSTPDYINIPCYFTNLGSSVMQNEPNTVVNESFKVHFPINTDIKVNDKIKKEDIFYKLMIPRNIRNHHIEVTVVREENL